MQKQNLTTNIPLTDTHKMIIEHIAEIVKKELLQESSGHDWYHVERVWKLSIEIALKESADIFLCSLIALLHDIADHKFGYSDSDRAHKIRDLLEAQQVATDIINQVIFIINNLSYKGGTNKHKFVEIEAKVVQDADRLDAIGAIGIARVFAYGGFAGKIMYNPDLPQYDDTVDTISHFYQKLLKLKDSMHTSYGKKLAQNRHQYMEAFLTEFTDEWNGIK